jgi:hypothetical protein
MGLNDFSEFFFERWPGGPYRLGSTKWAAMTFATFFGLMFLLGLFFAPSQASIVRRLSDIAALSALISAVVTAIVWVKVLSLRNRKRAPLSRKHRLRQRKR